MALDDHPESLPRVAAVLVVHDGLEWLPAVLAMLAPQQYPLLDLVVVDNASTDGSAELLARRIPADRLITLPRNLGFSRAVATGMRHEAVEAADAVLLLHDDMVLAPDALEHLVAALQRDPEVAVVGPKLREWLEEPVLQEVGMTIDRFGRAERRLERGELDQGQHDHRSDVLYVSSAGMLVRRDAFRDLGGFDPRFPVMREDLDLCWRAWLLGHRVQVVPEAVAYHVGATTRQLRKIGRWRGSSSRYFAERHGLAALLQNYGGARLAWALPVVLLLTVGKLLAFVATRRFGPASAVVRAYSWNLRQLPTTLRHRGRIQRARVRSDAELGHLFAPGLPRLREQAEAFGNWLAGGSTPALLSDADVVEQSSSGGLRGALTDHPAAAAGLVLLALYLIGLVPLLGAGQLIGGEILPWPDSARAFLQAYVTPWNGEPAGTGAFPSPAQALLGLGSLAGVGSAWLAQRLLVLGLLPLAWLTALRAGRLITSRPGPRVLGATLYALSPVVLGTLAQGRYGALVLAALLPGLVLVTARAADPATQPTTAWRATALLALGLAAAAGMAPALWPLPAALLIGGLIAASLSSRRQRPLLRLTVAGAGALGLLTPWLLDLLRVPVVVIEPAPQAPLPAWRALTGVPTVLPGLGDVAGVLTALTTAAVVLVAVLLGLRLRPALVAGLVAALVTSGVLAWGAAMVGMDWLWPPALLLPGALAVGGLGVVAARSLEQGLREYAFGLRQLSVVVGAAVLLVGLAGGLLRVASGPWDTLRRDPELVPLFVTADSERVGPYRVLLLRHDGDGVRWSLSRDQGPSMLGYGTAHSVELLAHVEGAVATAVGRNNPSAGALLGLANVRYVVIQDSPKADGLAQALAEQPDLEPQPASPASGGRVYRVRSWMPRAVVLPPDQGERLLATGEPGDTRAQDDRGLYRLGPASYRRVVDTVPGVLVVAEATSPRWQAQADGRDLGRLQAADPDWPLNAFAVPAGAEFVVVSANSVVHKLLVAYQVFLVLAIISLALRPPGFTQAAQQRRVGRALPTGVAPPAEPVSEEVRS